MVIAMEIMGSKYFAKDGKLLRKINDKEKLISNFVAKVISLNVYNTGNTEPIKKLYVKLYNDNAERYVNISSDELDTYDYTKLDYTFYFNPQITTARKEFGNYIRELTKNAPVNECCFIRELGWHRINNANIYCAGNILIGSDGTDFIIDH